MKLSKLLRKIDVIEYQGERDPEISGIKLDSRKVVPGDIFVAVPGFKEDGYRFIQDAKDKGASAVVTKKQLNSSGIACVRVENPRKALALLAKEIYKSPDEELLLLGVTGTNGKTTTATLIRDILAGGSREVSIIGTIQHQIQGRTIKAENTTPEASDLYALFREALDGHGDSMVMEVSSHALALDRIAGMRFSAAVFTNLTHDHLDFHKNKEEYFQTKAKLFIEHLIHGGSAVINTDDEYGMRLVDMLRTCRPDIGIVTYGFSASADVHPLDYQVTWQGISLKLSCPWGKLDLESSVTGDFNVYNIMAAAAVALSCGLKPDVVIKAVKEFSGVEGRFEKIELGQPFTVVVDYAHTPDALERLLLNVRRLTAGRLIAVFGCGGDRDKEKRRVMGRIASDHADKVFITSDNPRSEKPEAIIEDILSGVKSADVVAEPDREKAIEQSLNTARAGDSVVIAGKGHEKYQQIGSVKHPFCDRDVAGKYIEAMRR